MHSALFVANVPEAHDGWPKFLEIVQTKVRPSKDALRLAENVWLLNLQESVAPLGWLVAQADRFAIPYGILPFENKPEWLPAGFYPSTI
jgi:hypothetical protein